MGDNPEIKTPAAEWPVSPQDVRAHFKQLDPAEDGLIQAMIAACTDYLEGWLGRAFVARTLVLRLESFAREHRFVTPCYSDEIVLPYPPLVSVSSVTYDDVDGEEQTVSSDDYQVDTYSVWGRIRPVPDAAWPSTRVGYYNAVRIEYVAGHATAAAVPEKFKQLLRWMVAHWYRNREPVGPVELRPVPHTVEAFVEAWGSPYRITT